MSQAERSVKKILPGGIEERPPLHIAAYCRVSTASVDQEMSFAAQVRYYTEAIGKMENCVLADIYADEGFSGRGTSQREEFKRMIGDCKKGKINRILTKSVSRFARKAVRALIDCVKVQSQNKLLVIFKGGVEKTVTMG